MKRRRFSRSALADLYDAQGGRCAICAGSLVGKAWHADHEIPLAIGGADEVANLRLVCVPCHAEKTGRDLGAIAKAKRVGARHRGVRKASARPMPGNRNSKWKRKLNGEVVLR